MSLEAMVWALGVPSLSPTRRLALVVLGSYANRDGICWPGQRSIADILEISERALRDHLAGLETDELISRERRTNGRGHRTSDRFLLALPADSSGRPTGSLLPSLPADSRTGTTLRNPREEPKERGEVEAVVIASLFELWAQSTGRDPKRVKLTQGRRRCIRARLREGYPQQVIERAIRNVAASPFHRGENDRGARYDDLTLICRSGEKLEHYAEMTPPSGSKGVFVDE